MGELIVLPRVAFVLLLLLSSTCLTAATTQSSLLVRDLVREFQVGADAYEVRDAIIHKRKLFWNKRPAPAGYPPLPLIPPP